METEVEVEKLVEVPVDRIVYQDKIIIQERESEVAVESLVYLEKFGNTLTNFHERTTCQLIFYVLILSVEVPVETWTEVEVPVETLVEVSLPVERIIEQVVVLY